MSILKIHEIARQVVNKAGRAFEQTNLIQGLTDGIVGLISNILVLAGVMYIVCLIAQYGLLIPVF